LQFAGWNVEKGKEIVHEALVALRSLLLSLAKDPSNNFLLVDAQDLLQASDWANELHPTPNGFKLIAAKFANSLRLRFPSRI
jgi:hypothetical protein